MNRLSRSVIQLSAALGAAVLLLAGLSAVMAAPAGGGGAGGAPTLAGFGGVNWQTNFSSVKNHLKNLARSADADEKVEILSMVRNKYILVRRNDVLYRYNFYKTPLIIERISNHKITTEEHDQKEALLYHVKVSMPLIIAGRIKARLTKIYGRNTKTTVKKMAGADIWELNGGLVFQWHEPFNKTAFTRNVDYLSTTMATMIMKEYAQYFDARERLILKKLNLK